MRILVTIFALALTSCATKPVVQETQPQAASSAPTQGATEPASKTPVPEKKADAKAIGGELTCKFGDHVRTVRVDKPNQTSCEVIYTKDGQSNSIASAKNDLSHCDKVRDQIQTNLTAFGYTCQ